MKTLVALCVLAASGVASANPRALPFTYTTDTLPPGGVELEEFVDIVPRKALTATSSSGSGAWFLPSAFQTEIEIGLADRLELALYMTFVPSYGDAFLNAGFFPGIGNGLKQRIRYIFAEPNEWPVDLGVYLELTENERELEFESKLLIQRRFGDFRLAINASTELEYYTDTKQREFVLNPSAGVSYEVSARFHLGLDSWLRSEYPMNPKPAMRTFGLGPALYVGPAFMYNFGKIWWAVGGYVRVTDMDHELQPAEPYGPVYFRSMIGYDIK